jgi:hypothetical protein
VKVEGVPDVNGFEITPEVEDEEVSEVLSEGGATCSML